MQLWIITAIGFLAQAFFSSRIIVQWILSEREKKLVSPTWYWILSLAGSWLMFAYGLLRSDFSIIVGQFISYYIYIWNLDMKGVWQKVHSSIKVFLLATPLAVAGIIASKGGYFFHEFLSSESIPSAVLVFGTAGQTIFALRFVYQWLLSRKRGESSLPTSFWVLSFVSAAMIVIYGFLRHDIVLIIGQGFGVIVYFRNILIGLAASRREKSVDAGKLTEDF